MLTNIFFNLGYIYADIIVLLDLASASQNDTWYRDVGIYTGDIAIRTLWRRQFIGEFSYFDADE